MSRWNRFLNTPVIKHKKKEVSYKQYLHLTFPELEKKENEIILIIKDFERKIKTVYDYFDVYNQYLEKRQELSDKVWLELNDDKEYKLKKAQLEKLAIEVLNYRFKRFFFKNTFTKLDAKKNQLRKEVDDITKAKYIDEVEKRLNPFFKKDYINNPPFNTSDKTYKIRLENKLSDNKRILECLLKAKEIVKKRHEAQQNQIQRAKDETAKHKAHSYAYQEKTRELAEEVKKEIKSQLRKFKVCPYCEGDLGNVPHADHIYPVSKGGLSTKENMVYICQSCNSSKSDKTLNVFIKSKGFDREKVESNLDLLGKDY